MIQVPKNNRLEAGQGRKTPKKEVEPIAPNSKAESQTKYTIWEYQYR